MNMNLSSEKSYSENSFLNKINFYYKEIGSNLLFKALILFFVAKDKSTPIWTKSIIYGALGYLILPTDLIPDIAPIFGFSDDFSAIVTAISLIVNSIKDYHIESAKNFINKFF